MSTSSIGGLSSGLDTASIINQLMQVEALSQSRLKGRVASETKTVTSLQDLNSAMAALKTLSEDLAKATSFTKFSVATSSDYVSATGSSSSITGQISFTFNQLATAHSLSYTNTAAMTDVVTTGSTSVRLDFLDGTTLDLNTGDGTLSGLVSAINNAGKDLKASTVKLDDGTYRLKVASTKTGTAGDFTLKNLDGSDILGGATVTAGTNASITVGSDTITSASNTFSGQVNGLDITLSAGLTAGQVIDLDVDLDSDKMATNVKAMVDKVNSILDSIDKLTAYNATTKSGGALTSDNVVRNLRTKLLDSVYPTDGTSMAAFGVQTDRYGKLVFDADAFKKSVAADPTKAQAAFGTGTVDGFAARIAAVAKGASDVVDGSLTTSIKSRNANITQLNTSIASWDDRLTLRRATLTKTFTALETALNGLQSQSSWLTSQLAKL